MVQKTIRFLISFKPTEHEIQIYFYFIHLTF